MGKVDRVLIKNQAGIVVESYGILEEAKAIARAKEMQAYHEKPFTVTIENGYVDERGFMTKKTPRISH